jgi:hypothetical protein
MTASTKFTVDWKGTAMTLTELTALETAYHVLQPLDDTARRRALQWLSDALSQNQPLVTGVAAPVIAETAIAVPATRTRPRRSSATASTAPSSKTVNAKKVKTAVHNGKRTSKKASANGHERAYRRMPDPATVMKAYEKVGSISGLAEHFDVPPHTVTHWARRLRAQGYQIGRAA